jgi:hypothetical protein
MRSSASMVAAAIMLPQDVEAQGPWGNVKSWTGTVTIEAIDTRKGEIISSTMNYKASGKFTISDDMMPDGSHVMWPMPSAEAMSDPKKMAAANEAWQTRVIATYDAKLANESGGQPASVKCAADNQQSMQIGVGISPTEPTYFLSVTAPEALFKCTGGTHGLNPPRLQQSSFRLTGPRGAPGKVSGTKTFTAGTSTIKVTYDMAPANKK